MSEIKSTINAEVKIIYLLTQYYGDTYDGNINIIDIYSNEKSAIEYMEKYNGLLKKLMKFYSIKDENGDDKKYDDCTETEMWYVYKRNELENYRPIIISEMCLKN